MPIATPEIYADMLDRAQAGDFAYPAINCTSSETINAALKGFADAGSDDLYVFNTQTQADEGATSQGYVAGVEYACGTIVEGSDSGGTLATDLTAACQAPAPGVAGAIDTNGTAGVSHASGSWSFDVDGNDLVGSTFRGRRLDPK